MLYFVLYKFNFYNINKFITPLLHIRLFPAHLFVRHILGAHIRSQLLLLVLYFDYFHFLFQYLCVVRHCHFLDTLICFSKFSSVYYIIIYIYKLTNKLLKLNKLK